MDVLPSSTSESSRADTPSLRAASPSVMPSTRQPSRRTAPVCGGLAIGPRGFIRRTSLMVIGRPPRHEPVRTAELALAVRVPAAVPAPVSRPLEANTFEVAVDQGLRARLVGESHALRASTSGAASESQANAGWRDDSLAAIAGIPENLAGSGAVDRAPSGRQATQPSRTQPSSTHGVRERLSGATRSWTGVR